MLVQVCASVPNVIRGEPGGPVLDIASGPMNWNLPSTSWGVYSALRPLQDNGVHSHVHLPVLRY